jgi:biopolymer transport protein ExbB
MKTASLWKILLVCFAVQAAGAVSARASQAWWNNDWTLRKKITIDTGSTGVPISDAIGTSPVLIRLHDGDFQFASARDDGSDIRFVAGDDKTPLAFHIEKYDSLLGEAFVWVKVPDLKPGATTTLWLYYGNSSSTPMSGGPDAKATYDGDTTLVYHFAEAAQPPKDSTGNGNDASNAGANTDGSFIGPGLKLTGKAGVTIPTSASLNWAAGSSLTWSAWVKATVLAPNTILYSRHDGDHALLIGVDNGVPFVDVDGTRSSGGAPIAANSWHHLSVVADAGKITVYLDGAAYGSLATALPALNSAATIGMDTAPAGAAATNAGLVGEMDELEISKVARPVGFLQLAALGQGGDSAAKLLVVAPDEPLPASWLSGSLGLFGVILKSVTIDGWVVIGVLGIMSGVSWYVMITKWMFLGQVEKTNKIFFRAWSKVAVDLTALDQKDTDNVKTMGGQASPKVQRRLYRRSPVYRIYHIGSEEIGHRIKNGRNLSARSIQAIRASLDGGYVRENHRINSGMVFLTISIAGGPFMGLLGTCIGVMITFAAIAATGEVNISAIAPGLAAALVATVAGLLVAIPALLGYNYLVSRMKVVSSDMQVFIDEFVTKMAEFYSDDVEIERVPVERD